ncbi:galactose oxidase [Hufsiella ginkgonis]|uniref:Galactose oxidase n=1 Tax=Hufsiella ginkgonis TaxID=2695274 RepID=A0A7K1Y302_9SPHI|nr:galactose oxidase [Hufsiella ginkgonis]MXV17673.1 galactose oxidase [Hufsiella ginkgonis]
MGLPVLNTFVKSVARIFLCGCFFTGFGRGLPAVAQSYGLAFSSYEAVQDARTELDLSPGATLCFKENFELSFDFDFVANQQEYFGYIFRMIDNDKRNIDLIWDNRPWESTKDHFKFVVGDNPSRLTFNIDKEVFSKKWNRIHILFDFERKTLSYSLDNGKKHSQKISITRGNCYKILFGANNYGDFKTTDVPPMKIRNIRITEGSEITYDWPLDEQDGKVVREVVNERNGEVTNPMWIRKMHYEWRLLKKIVVDGPVSTAFDRNNELLTVVGPDSLLQFNVSRGSVKKIRYASGVLNLLRGNQSLYDTGGDKLFNLYLDQNAVAAFDTKTSTWDSNFKAPVPITDNWHYNKFYSAADSAIYILCGYGHFIYKNAIRRYHLPTKTWSEVKTTGDFFTPRYLAALGETADGAYLLGGYGSTSGQQIINPKNLYDLIYFDRRKKSIKKIYDLKIPGEDFVMANSLVVDEKTRSYYGLIFPKHKYNSTLQLIRGSLDSAGFHPVGGTLPYEFHDINSFSDLYYSPVSGNFIAVTLFLTDNNQTRISVYALSGPPLEMINAGIAGPGGIKGPFLLLVIVAGVVLAGGTWFAFRRITSKKSAMAEQKGSLPQPPPGSELSAVAIPAGVTELPREPEPEEAALLITVTDEENPKGTRSAIFLFGDLQLFDTGGNDITKYFTPLIKELFLVILLYTIRWERGISSEKLKELLWFDKTAESARNNRSVNIAKLKAILEKLQDCEVSKETGYWKINLNYDQVSVDYYNYLSIVKDKRKLNKQKVKELAEIIQRGSFLSNLDYEWLDAFKSDISNEVIDTYLHYAHSADIAEDPEFLIKIASYVFYFDSVNEEAMILKCKALVHLGKHSLAKTTFENFKKEYKAIYGEEFGRDFHAILE